MGKEQFIGDHGDESAGHQESGPSGMQLRRVTGWFGRMNSLLRKTEPESEYPPFSNVGSSSEIRERVRPNLRISVDRASAAMRPQSEVDHTQHHLHNNPNPDTSRWSTSPDFTHAAPKPWLGITAPSRSPTTSTAAPPQVTSPPLLPFRFKPRPSVPSDVGNSMYENTEPTPQPTILKPSPLAVPLYSGFESSSQAPRKERIHPLHPGVIASAYDNSPFPPKVKNLVPPALHRRSSSLPGESPRTAGNPFSDENKINGTAGTTRMLTTTSPHTRPSGNPMTVNPFMTPFDDEHRVTTNTMNNFPPPPAGINVQTNPFVAL